MKNQKLSHCSATIWHLLSVRAGPTGSGQERLAWSMNGTESAVICNCAIWSHRRPVQLPAAIFPWVKRCNVPSLEPTALARARPFPAQPTEQPRTQRPPSSRCCAPQPAAAGIGRRTRHEWARDALPLSIRGSCAKPFRAAHGAMPPKAAPSPPARSANAGAGGLNLKVGALKMPGLQISGAPLGFPGLNLTPVPKAEPLDKSVLKDELGFITIGSQTYRCTPEDFKNLGEIGRGTFGVVVKQMHTPTKTVMAVKHIRDSMKLEEREKLIREITFIKKSKSPFIVNYHGLNFYDGDILIFMELMQMSLDAVSGA